MSGVNVEGNGGGRRTLDAELNMVPMIDLLMCLICFLLITAVWSTMSRLEARTDVPGDTTGPTPESVPVLHVAVDGDERFRLTWRKDGAVLASRDVPMKAVSLGEGRAAQTVYPELASAITEEWRAVGSHRDESDRKLDQAVVHCDDRTPYARLVAVIDAVYRTKRRFPGGGAETYPAMNVAFARSSN